MVSSYNVRLAQGNLSAKQDSEMLRAIRQFVRRRSALVGLTIVLILLLTAILSPVLQTHDPLSGDIRNDRFLPPSLDHYFGTDSLGRDVFSRVLAGAIISIQVGLFPVVIGLVIGLPLGLISGYYGGRIDSIVMGIVDVMLCFPGILLAMVIVAILGVGLTNVMIAVGIGLAPQLARQVRAESLSLREREFVQATRALGATDRHIILRQIFPNLVPTITVQLGINTATALLAAAGLSFLGLGAQPPTPEWGAMLADGRQYLRNEWWIATFPGIAIFMTVLGINLFGEGLRDALDPQRRN